MCIFIFFLARRSKTPFNWPLLNHSGSFLLNRLNTPRSTNTRREGSINTVRSITLLLAFCRNSCKYAASKGFSPDKWQDREDSDASDASLACHRWCVWSRLRLELGASPGFSSHEKFSLFCFLFVELTNLSWLPDYLWTETWRCWWAAFGWCQTGKACRGWIRLVCLFIFLLVIVRLTCQ